MKMTRSLPYLLTLVCLVLASPIVLADQQTIGAREQGDPATNRIPGTEFHNSVRTVRVNCDHPGKTIAKALRKKADRLIVEFRGTCEEHVEILRDNVTLQGGDPLATILGSISARGASNLQLNQFTVKDSPGNAIDIIQGSAATLRKVTVDNAGNRGIRVAQSTADLEDITVTAAGTVGILGRAGELVLTGTITSTGLLAGLSLADGSTVFSPGGDITLTDGNFGLVVEENSAFSKPFGSITATNNGTGILVAAQGHISYGADLNASDNFIFGIWINELSSFSVFEGFVPPPQTTIDGNGIFGILIDSGASLTLVESTSISGSIFGIEAEAAIVELSGTTFSGNFVADLDLGFTTRVTFGDGNTVGTIFCEDSVTSRGTTTCPAPRPALNSAASEVKVQIREGIASAQRARAALRIGG